jgi:predicted O-methyltransferase YrrM
MTDERGLRLKPWRWSLRARILWALLRSGRDAEKVSLVVEHILQSYRVQTTDLKGAHKAEDRFNALSIGAERTKDIPGLAVEFGVFQGITLRHLAKEIGPDRRIVGFDTFEGLPDNWGNLLKKGTFATRMPSFDDLGNVSLEVGRIEETLPKFLLRNAQRISFVHIDCPYYDINIFILERVLPFMPPGSVVVFDEYYGYPTYEQHEFKAWSEIRSRFDIVSAPIAYSSRSAAFRIDFNPLYVT